MELLLSNKFSVIVSVITVVIYAIPYPKSNKTDLADAVSIFLATLSIFGGLKVGRIAFEIEKCEVLKVGDIEQSYIVIGVLAMLWISVGEIKKKFQEKYKMS